MKAGLVAGIATNCIDAAIEGVVFNQTLKRPQAGVTVTVEKPSRGQMRVVASTVSDASGRFTFKDQAGLAMLRAHFAGVTYNRSILTTVSGSKVELDVYATTKSAQIARVARHLLFIEPKLDRTELTEAILVENDGETTFVDAGAGELQFYLPQRSAGQVRVIARGPQSLADPIGAFKTKQAEVSKASYLIQPGRTDFEIHYSLPNKSPFIFQGRVIAVKGMSSDGLRLVAPRGVTFDGKDLKKVGADPRTQLTLYDVTATNDFTVAVTGAGTLHEPSGLERNRPLPNK